MAHCAEISQQKEDIMFDEIIKVVVRTGKRYFSDGVSKAATQLAYYLFFSIFPILILLNTIITRIDIDIISVINRFSDILPEAIVSILIDYIGYLDRIDSTSIFMVGLTTTLFALTRSFNSLLTSVRQAYHIKKGGIVNYLTAAMFSAIILLSFFALSFVAMAGEVALDILMKYISIPMSIISLLGLLKNVFIPVYMLLVLSGFYYIVPSRRYPFKSAIPGAAFAVAGITVVTWGFSFYVSNYSNYSMLYGSLAAIMILMLWLQLVASILIMGGVFNDVLNDIYRKDK